MKTTFFKTKTILVVTFCLVLASFFTTSCSKPENGTDGTNGTNGTNGINGTNGTTGQTGNANVFASAWAGANLPGNFGGFSVTFSATPVTQQVIDKAVVLVYFKKSDDLSRIYQLPYYSSPSLYFNYFIRVGDITVAGLNDNTVSITISMRYIIIPSSTGNRLAAPQPDYKSMTYAQVCASLNIPE